MSTTPPETIHPIQEIADRFHVHVQTVRVWIRKAELGSVKVGRYTYVTDDQLAAFIAARRTDVD